MSQIRGKQVTKEDDRGWAPHFGGCASDATYDTQEISNGMNLMDFSEYRFDVAKENIMDGLLTDVPITEPKLPTKNV